MIYLQLFFSFFQIGLFSFGGGYASLPLIQDQVVSGHHWLTMQEFSDIVTISQMTPGPVAINASTFTGTQIAGVWGAVVATIGCVMPSVIIVLVLAVIYNRYKNLPWMQAVLKALRPAVIVMIASAAVSLILLMLWGNESAVGALKEMNLPGLGIFAISLIVLRKTKVNPILVMIGAGIAGLFL